MRGTERLRVVAIIQARMSSSRFPGKMLKIIGSLPVLAWTAERMGLAKTIHEVIVGTSDQDQDDPIAKLCHDYGIRVFRGAELDVLDRYYKCASEYNATHVVRVTGDCPFIDPSIVDDVVTLCLADERVEYASNHVPMSFPEGMSVEVMPTKTLEIVWHESVLPSHREHVTPFIRFQPSRFSHANLKSPIDLSNIRLTVDYKDDLLGLDRLAKLLESKGFEMDFALDDVISILESEPTIQALLNPRERDLWRHQVAREEGGQYA